MNYNQLPLERRLFFFDEVLTVTDTDPTVVETITAFGFTPDVLARGREIYTATYDAYTQRKELYAAQLEVTERLKTLIKAFRIQFTSDRQVVRGLLENKRSVREPFELNDHMPRNRESMLNQAILFYNAVKGDGALMTILQERFMIQADVFDTRLVEANTLVAVINEQQVKRADAQVATQRRDEAAEVMDAWMASFLAVARQAFRKEKKQLEKLGLKIVLNPTKPAKENKEGEGAGQEGTAAEGTTQESTAPEGTAPEDSASVSTTNEDTANEG